VKTIFIFERGNCQLSFIGQQSLPESCLVNDTAGGIDRNIKTCYYFTTHYHGFTITLAARKNIYGVIFSIRWWAIQDKVQTAGTNPGNAKQRTLLKRTEYTMG